MNVVNLTEARSARLTVTAGTIVKLLIENTRGPTESRDCLLVALATLHAISGYRLGASTEQFIERVSTGLRSALSEDGVPCCA